MLTYFDYFNTLCFDNRSVFICVMNLKKLDFVRFCFQKTVFLIMFLTDLISGWSEIDLRGQITEIVFVPFHFPNFPDGKQGILSSILVAKSPV